MVDPLLLTFSKVAEMGSFSKAAQIIHISPNSVMKQMNQLEAQMDMELFIRTNHGVTLSEAGESLYSDTCFMLQYAEKAMERARQISKRDIHIIRVGDSVLNPFGIMREIWNKVIAMFPEYKIDVVPFRDDAMSIGINKDLVGSRFDIMAGPYDIENSKSVFNVLKLGTSPICVAVPRLHHLSVKAILRINDLFGERLIINRRGTSHVVDSIRNDLTSRYPEIQIEDAPEFYDIDTFNAAERKGYLLLSMSIWDSCHPSFNTIPVMWDYSSDYGIKYPLNPSVHIASFIRVADLLLHS